MKLRRTLIDNSPEGYNMTEVLKECLKDKNVTEVYIATGFWDLRGTALVYDELVEFLSREGSKFRLLIGKDPYLYSSDTESFTKGRYDKQEQAWRVDLDKFFAQEQYVKVVQMLVDNLKDKNSEKFQIHIYNPDGNLKDQFLHSKCYIFKGYDHEDECHVGYGIIGSTNFTQKGLEGNSELNTLEVNARDVISLDPEFKRDKTHLLWFNEKWENSISWEEEFLLQITLSKMATDITIPEPEATDAEQPFTPYELYIKLLQTYFGDIIDKNLGEQIEAYLPQKMICLQFQIEAVKRCLSIMHEHGGFMLADVVGLGKTIIGTLVIKRFLTVPEDDDRERRVLIVTPPAIKSAWVKTIESFDKDSDDRMMPKIDFITTGRIGGMLDDAENEEADEDEGHDSGEFADELSNTHYGLIIIDESHKFRNSNTLMYQALDDLIGLIGAETGTYPYIGLLSATPQNNRPNDLKNQIYLFERNHTDSTLKKARSGNIESFFADADSEYRLLIRKDSDIPKEERRTRLKELSRQIRDCVLSDILVRRTRTDVEKYYAEDIEAKGLKFPRTIGPKKLEYILDSELSHLFSDTMTLVAPSEEEMMRGADYLGYYRYRAIEFFKDEDSKKKYEGRGNRSAEAVAKQLADIMQMLLVKRLESSFAAFTQSLLNLRRYTENMIRMWEKNIIFVCPDIDINNELDTIAKTEKRGKHVKLEDCFEDIRKKIAKLNESGRNERGQNAEYTRNDFDAEYAEHLRNDFELINQLCERWARNTEDPKFDAFKENLRPVFFNADTNTSGKLVIFSEAIDTVKALTRAVQAKGYRVLEITAKNRHEMEETIAANFDANYDENKQKNDYDVIITTEVLAEGINLHRANVIINYDTPWNSTRLMQRIGRVNRVGSKESFVYVYNFFPSAEGDAEISLVQKAYTKLQSFHILFGEDNKVFTDEEEVMQYEQTAIIDDGESSMEQYIFELKQYREEHPQRFEQIEATEGQWEIASYLNGNAYFLIKAPRSSRLAVMVPNVAGEKPRIISSIEMLEAFQVAENTQSTPLPENWAELSKAALLAYNQYFIRINSSRTGSKGAEAKEVLHRLQQNSNLTAETKSLLISARRLVDQGNYDLIKKILTLKEYINDAQRQLFELGNEDINQLIEREIAKLVAKVEAKQEQASILLGTVR